MSGANPNPKASTSHSNKKSRWESGTKNPPSDTNTNTNKSTKPDRPSSGPSKLSPIKHIPPSSAAGLLPPPGGPGPAFSDQSAPLFPDPSNLGPPPPPAYGFHMLHRRNIALADGSVRSYLALPPDYQDLPPQQASRPFDLERFFAERAASNAGIKLPPGGGNMLSPREEMFGRGGGGPTEALLKRKYEGDERDGRDPRERDEFARQRQQLLQYGNPSGNPNGFPSHLGGTSSPFGRDVMDHGRGLEEMRASKHMRMGGEYDLSSGRGMGSGGDGGLSHLDVDPQALKKAFLKFVKLINENAEQKSNYLENGKHGALHCLACGRASKEFPEMHSLIVHAYSSHSADLHVDHLGLHKALCILMGWNYAKVPDTSKAYQSLSANEAEANKEDLIMWPPLVIIHNTNTGRGKDGRTEGMGNKVMDNKLKDLGFGGGKAKSLYAKEGHLGITLVKFGPDQSGLKEAVRLAEFFEKDYHGRNGWDRAQASQSGRDDENNPNLVKVDEKTREKQRILYGYLATAFDLEKVDAETRKKASIDSKREVKP